MVFFHNPLPRILDYIEAATSSALHSSTFSNFMNGDMLSIEDALSALFESDEVKDDFLVFEVRVWRHAVTLTQMRST